MIIQRVEHPEWLSNAYLLADTPGGHGFFVDGNGLMGELEKRADDDGIRITHVLCTHGHMDHIAGLEELAARRRVPLLAPRGSAVMADSRLSHGDLIRSGGLQVTALATPGHCEDHLAYQVGDTHCLTADVLFKGTVGGTAGPSGDLGKLKHSILEVLLTLGDETIVLPGHCEATTIGAERRSNPFVRAWLTGEGLGEEPCLVGGEEATLLLWAPDYDGGNKALVRFPPGEETIVGGSRVSRPKSGSASP
jgi:hydroxyacylglutathione hydrolase